MSGAYYLRALPGLGHKYCRYMRAQRPSPESCLRRSFSRRIQGHRRTPWGEYRTRLSKIQSGAGLCGRAIHEEHWPNHLESLVKFWICWFLSQGWGQNDCSDMMVVTSSNSFRVKPRGLMIMISILKSVGHVIAWLSKTIIGTRSNTATRIQAQANR